MVAKRSSMKYFFGKFPLYTIKLPKGCVHEDSKTNSKKDYFAVQTKNPHR
jgi:hypothetical protein